MRPAGSDLPGQVACLCLLLLLANHSILLSQNQDDSGSVKNPLKTFQLQYEQFKEEATQPILQLKAGYLNRLSDELEAAKAEGILKRVQGILAEIEWVEGKGKMPGDEDVRTILGLRNLYLSTLKEREQERIEALEDVLRRSETLLENIQKDFTREGKIDEAVAAQKFSEEARADIARLKGALETPGVRGLKEGDTVLWQMESAGDFKEVEGCVAKKLGGSWTLTSPAEKRGHIESNKTFTPPFRISALVASESGDLRFYYGPETSMEFVLFNWTRNPTTLRLADPSKQQGIQSVPERGLLRVGETYHIEVLVEERKIEVFVNGELRGNTRTDLSRFREHVGIGPFGTATVPGRLILENFTVIQPKE